MLKKDDIASFLSEFSKKNTTYQIIDRIEGVMHECHTFLRFVQLVRDLTLNYGDFLIEQREEIEDSKNTYIIFEISK